MANEHLSPNSLQNPGWVSAGRMLRAKMKKARVNGKMVARHLLWHEHGISRCLNGHQGFPAEHLTPALVYLMAHGAIFEPREVRSLFAAYTIPITEAELFDLAERVSRFREAGIHPTGLGAIAEKFREGLTATSPVADGIDTDQPQLANSLDVPGESLPPATSVADTLKAWQRQLAEVGPGADRVWLDPDEVIALALAWERELSNPEIAAPLWDWLADGRMQVLRYRPRLEFSLNRIREEPNLSWNKMAWQWLDHALFETARRHMGKAHATPADVVDLVSSLGAIAFSAIRSDAAHLHAVAINLEEARKAMPLVQGSSWGWLEHIGKVGLLQLGLTNGQCEFRARDMAEFLAAHFLLQPGHEQQLQELLQNCGRPQGVFRQVIRILRFGGNERRVMELLQERSTVRDLLDLQYLDVARLLGDCDAGESELLPPLIEALETRLCAAWAETEAPDYRTAIAGALGALDSNRFIETIWSLRQREALMRDIAQSLAAFGGPTAAARLGELATAIGSSLILEAAPNLPAGDAAALLETLADTKDEEDAGRAIRALTRLNSIPAVRSLTRIIARHAGSRLALDARWNRASANLPAYAAVIADKLEQAIDASRKSADVLLPLVEAACSIIQTRPGTETAKQQNAACRALGRIWVDESIDPNLRQLAALGLQTKRTRAAFEPVIRTLPLIDVADHPLATWFEHLLVATAGTDATDLIRPALSMDVSAQQRAALIRCLGMAGGIEEDAQFEAWLNDSAEAVALAAIEALASSQGLAAITRLRTIGESGSRLAIREAALCALGRLGDEAALPYLLKTLSDPESNLTVVEMLSRMQHPLAEQALAEAAAAEASRSHVALFYLPALARSGGPIAVAALYNLLGPAPDEGDIAEVERDLAADTVARAPKAWLRLTEAPSPTWRRLAAIVMARDGSQQLIHIAARMALEDGDAEVRAIARRTMEGSRTSIASDELSDYLLRFLEMGHGDLDERALFAVLLLGRCVAGGIGQHDWRFAPRVARLFDPWLEAIAAEPQSYGEATVIALLKVYAHPRFQYTAPALERIASGAQSPAIQLQAIETLRHLHSRDADTIAIRASRASRWPEVREQLTTNLADSLDEKRAGLLIGTAPAVMLRMSLTRDLRVVGPRGFYLQFRTPAPFALICANGQRLQL